MAIFRFFKIAAAAILDFSNFIFLTVETLKRAELRRRAKFGQNRSKRGGDIAIFWFFKMAARQTDRQTDGQATANSESEREFTFAKTDTFYELALNQQYILFRLVNF